MHAEDPNSAYRQSISATGSSTVCIELYAARFMTPGRVNKPISQRIPWTVLSVEYFRGGDVTAPTVPRRMSRKHLHQFWSVRLLACHGARDWTEGGRRTCWMQLTLFGQGDPGADCQLLAHGRRAAQRGGR